jgi:hypothetical protein
VAELTREVRRELRFDSYADAGENFCWEQPPKTKVSVAEVAEESEGAVAAMRKKKMERVLMMFLSFAIGISGEGEKDNSNTNGNLFIHVNYLSPT